MDPYRTSLPTRSSVVITDNYYFDLREIAAIAARKDDKFPCMVTFKSGTERGYSKDVGEALLKALSEYHAL